MTQEKQKDAPTKNFFCALAFEGKKQTRHATQTWCFSDQKLRSLPRNVVPSGVVFG
jgi:hypothetical protein